jgi:hypothetical protein
MKYFKKLNEDGTLQRLDACEFNSCDGIEITEEEYNALMPKVEYVETDEEYAEVLKAEETEEVN